MNTMTQRNLAHLGAFLAIGTTLFFFSFVSGAFAQGASGAGGGGASGAGCPAGQLCNPLKATSITQFLLALIDIILIFAMPIIVFFIIYAGFLFVTARGNEGQIEKARTALTWAVIGGVIVVGAKSIVDIVQNTVKSI